MKKKGERKKTREKQQKEVKAQGTREEQGKGKALGERDRGGRITREECVEQEKNEVDTDLTFEDKNASNRHMTWWKRAWWIRFDDGSSMRSARGRRRVWRAARRAAEQARDGDRVGKGQSPAEEAQ